MIENFSVVTADGKTTITFTDRHLVFESQAVRFGRQISLLLAHGFRRIVFDFRNVEYCSAEVIGALCTLRAEVEKEGGSCCVCSVTAKIHDIFTELAGSRPFEIFPSRQEALAA